MNTDNIKKYWNNVFSDENINKVYDGWLDDFNDIIDDCDMPILDLGCGGGNDLIYLCGKNKRVAAVDISVNAINLVKKRFPNILDAKCLDMQDGLPYEDNYFKVIIADLSLHYFIKETTEKVINELKRILCNNGYLIIRVNSVNDINHGSKGEQEVEFHLYKTHDGRLKRFFDEEDIKTFFKDFDIIFLKEEIMTRYELEKTLYRVCMRKK